MDGLIDKSIHDFVVGDDHGFFRSDFDEARHFHRLFANLLYLVDFGDFVNELNYLVIVGCHLFDPLFDLGHQDGLFLDYLHLLHLLSDVRHDLLDLSVFFLHHDVLLHFRYLLHNCVFLYHLHDLLNLARDLLDFFHLLLHQD